MRHLLLHFPSEEFNVSHVCSYIVLLEISDGPYPACARSTWQFRISACCSAVCLEGWGKQRVPVRIVDRRLHATYPGPVGRILPVVLASCN